MRLSRWSWVLTVALVAALAPGVAAKSPPYTIGYDIYFAGNSWSVQLYEEFKAEVARQGDLIRHVYYTESQGDSARQVANIEDLITRGVDAIILSPISPTAVVPVLERASRAGIVVVLLGARANTDKYSALVTVDDYEFGRVGAQWLAEKLGGRGRIIALNGIAGISASEERWQGARDVFARYPGIQVVASVNADWDYAKARVAVENLLAAHPQIDGVWSQGGAMTLAAIEAMEAAGRRLVPMTGEDNNGFLKKWKQLRDRSGWESIALSKPTWLASEALRVALKILRGQSVQKDLVLPVPVITNADLDVYVREDLPDSYWAATRLTEDQIRALFKR